MLCKYTLGLTFCLLGEVYIAPSYLPDPSQPQTPAAQLPVLPIPCHALLCHSTTAVKSTLHHSQGFILIRIAQQSNVSCSIHSLSMGIETKTFYSIPHSGVHNVDFQPLSGENTGLKAALHLPLLSGPVFYSHLSLGTP